MREAPRESGEGFAVYSAELKRAAIRLHVYGHYRPPADRGGRQLSRNETGARDAELNSQRTPDTTTRRCGDTTPRRPVGDPSASSDSHRSSPRWVWGARLETT